MRILHAPFMPTAALRCGLLAVVCLALAPPLAAQEEADPVAAARESYQNIARLSQSPDSDSVSGLTGLVEQLQHVRQVAQRCVEDAGRLLERQRRQESALLGSALPGAEAAAEAEAATQPSTGPGEPGALAAATPEHRALLTELNRQRGQIESRKAMCRLLELNVVELVSDLLVREQQALAASLLERDANVLEVLRTNLGKLNEWPRAAQDMALLLSGLEELGWYHWAILFALLLASVLVGVTWRRRAARLRLPEGELPFTTNLLIATRGVLRARAPLFAALVAVNAYLLVLYYTGETPELFTKLAIGALAMLLLAMLCRVLLDPPAPATPLVQVAEGRGKILSHLLQTLSLLILIGLLLGEIGRLHLIDHSKLLFLGQVYILALALTTLATIRFARIEGSWRQRLLRFGLPALTVLVVVVSMWLGYYNLSTHVLHASAGTVLAIFTLKLFSSLIEDLQDGLDSGRYAWQRAVRRSMGLAHDEPVPALGWLLLVMQIGLWLLFIAVLLRIWGMPSQFLTVGNNILLHGVQIGAVEIVPSRILWAILVLLVMLTAVRWVRGQLESRWLLRTRMERGAREAVATSFGYAGIAAVILFSLSMAGIDFANLALIAGALSVGIGFGLQNVVNNFISGLIMLFERPVKTGDWIVVGNTEGYVRRISIRTTTIETFDRSEVIVPNSELISNQVTNWMHNNNYGRFKVPIGVAYGSDTEKVRELLLQVAKEHPKVVRGYPSWPDPWVLFMGFGASSLDFELRGIVYNVDTRLSVISDLNFAIDNAFREHGIEIPFPQRVVHMAGEAAPEAVSRPVPPDVPPDAEA